MAPPQQLAFPPTALRNVAAGLVVGNPIGSSGTRGKALTSAELKAIVEASGISYLPLSGGTLTGPITGTGGLIEQRDGLTAQCFDLFETYTSGTNNGKLRFKATSSGHQIGSARATSGSNRAVQLGHFNSSGVFTSALSAGTDGVITVDSGFVSSNWIRLAGSNFPTRCVAVRDAQLNLASNVGIYWSTTLDPTASAAGGSIQMLSGVLTISGQITHVPPSLITLATNGQFSIEMTSNTAGNLVYRGSDGTTRRMALTFS